MTKDLSSRVNEIRVVGGLSASERAFLAKYAPVAMTAEANCEYCGNGCGTSDCMSCCSSADDYVRLKPAVA